MSKIMIPAKVLRAAVLFASKDGATHVLCGVRVAWDAEGDWEVDATDSFRLFEAWSNFLIREPKGAIILDGDVLESLKASDTMVEVDTGAGELTVHRRRGGVPLILRANPIDGNFPNVHRLLDTRTEVEEGHPGVFSAAYLQSFCKAADIMIGRRSARHVKFSQRTEDQSDARMRAAVIDWPRLHEEEGFWARGILMPIRP